MKYTKNFHQNFLSFFTKLYIGFFITAQKAESTVFFLVSSCLIRLGPWTIILQICALFCLNLFFSVVFTPVSHCEGMHIFPLKMTVSEETAATIYPGSDRDPLIPPRIPNPVSNRVPIIQDVPVSLPSVTQKRDDLPSLLAFLKPEFNPETEILSIFNKYLSLCEANNSDNIVNIVLESFPPIEKSEIFSHPIIKPFPNSPSTHSDRVINYFHEVYYLNPDAREDIVYLLTIFKLYAVSAHQNLSTVEAKVFITNMDDEQLTKLIQETCSRLEYYARNRAK
jgi:hypothetical protein